MLTLKQASFVTEYARSGNATQSAIKAGYSEKTARSVGSENLTKPDIIAALSEIHATAVQVVEAERQEAVASAAWIVRESVRLYARCMDGEPITTSDGTPTGEWKFDSSGANRALDRLAKMHPEFSEKHEVTGDLRVRMEALSAVAVMTPDQVRALAEGARGA